MRIRRLLSLLAALVVVSGIAAADGGSPASEPESVPLFTNEDLEKYGPSDAPERPVAEAVAGGEQDWTFVNDFIEGQYEKIRAEREHALELSDLDSRRDEPEWDGWSGRLLLAPGSPLWWYDWYGPPVYPSPYDKHGIRTHSNDPLTGHSARSGRVVRTGRGAPSGRTGGRSSRSGGHSGRSGGGGSGSRR